MAGGRCVCVLIIVRVIPIPIGSLIREKFHPCGVEVICTIDLEVLDCILRMFTHYDLKAVHCRCSVKGQCKSGLGNEVQVRVPELRSTNIVERVEWARSGLAVW